MGYMLHNVEYLKKYKEQNRQTGKLHEWYWTFKSIKIKINIGLKYKGEKYKSYFINPYLDTMSSWEIKGENK